MMNDPSDGLQAPLPKHVHLMSAHQFPLVAHLNIEQVFRYLLDAPSIVKQVAPMSWTYVSAPVDGTLWLEWLSPKQQGRFPSDGYIWGDPETGYRQEYNGYTIESVVHQLGYRPQMDHMASHSRTRYHFVAKAPHVAAAPPDPSLWIVHYHQAQNNRILPAAQIQPDPTTRMLLQERRFLESRGTLERKDFMLHDREHWPTIQVPSGHVPQMHQPGFYGAANHMPNQNMMMAQNRFGQQPFPQPAGGPPSKRQRTQGPAPMPGIPQSDLLEMSIMDEEDTAQGDYFDHLSPRDISLARYQQHHRWMEEVFSSPYASGQIVPADLGLGLMGELKGLTEGILEPPSVDLSGRQDTHPGPKEAPAFTNLKQEQIEEFNKRVQKHIDDGQAEIERMRAEHATRMAEWRKTKGLMQAEKRLRFATWEGHEAATPAYRLEVPVAVNGQAEQIGKETIEDVVKDMEGLIDGKLAVYQETSLIEKGGLEEEDRTRERVQDVNTQQGAQQQQSQPNVQTEVAPQDRTLAAPAASSTATQQLTQQTNAPSVPAIGDGQADVDDGVDDGVDLDLPDGMDIDGADFNFDADVSLSAGQTPSGPNATETGNPAGTAPPAGTSAQRAPTQATPAQTSSHVATQPAAAAKPPTGTTSTSDVQPSVGAVVGATPGVTSTPGALDTPDLGDPGSMFADDAFNDFPENLGAGAEGGEDGAGGLGVDDDGLIDFGGDMEDSAFGDAMHGMD